MPLGDVLYLAYNTVFAKNKKFHTLFSKDLEFYHALNNYAQIVSDKMMQEQMEFYQAIIKEKEDIIAELQHEV